MKIISNTLAYSPLAKWIDGEIVVQDFLDDWGDPPSDRDLFAHAWEEVDRQHAAEVGGVRVSAWTWTVERLGAVALITMVPAETEGT